MTLFSDQLEEYARQMSSAELPVLQRLSRETYAKVLNPRMLSGHIQGQILQLISTLHAPSAILEIGTYTGYSAICLAQGLKPGGVLHTIESNPELEDFVKNFFVEAGLEQNIKMHIGNALEVIPQLNMPFDLVFIDADKENYLRYFELVYDSMPSGGIILADNVLWSGKVLSPPAENDIETRGIILFNDFIRNHPGITHFILPYRDGLSVIRKK